MPPPVEDEGGGGGGEGDTDDDCGEEKGADDEDEEEEEEEEKDSRICPRGLKWVDEASNAGRSKKRGSKDEATTMLPSINGKE